MVLKNTKFTMISNYYTSILSKKEMQVFYGELLLLNCILDQISSVFFLKQNSCVELLALMHAPYAYLINQYKVNTLIQNIALHDALWKFKLFLLSNKKDDSNISITLFHKKERTLGEMLCDALFDYFLLLYRDNPKNFSAFFYKILL